MIKPGYIIAIDPSNKKSAFCITDPELRPVAIGKNDNELMYCDLCEAIVQNIPSNYIDDGTYCVIEFMQNYGMPVGNDVLETAAWIGHLEERLRDFEPARIKRSDERMAICHSMHANDATIKHALIDRFAPDVPNFGKGTKREPGWFYGFREDIWQAYAVAVTYHDTVLMGGK